MFIWSVKGYGDQERRAMAAETITVPYTIVKPVVQQPGSRVGDELGRFGRRGGALGGPGCVWPGRGPHGVLLAGLGASQPPAQALSVVLGPDASEGLRDLAKNSRRQLTL